MQNKNSDILRLSKCQKCFNNIGRFILECMCILCESCMEKHKAYVQKGGKTYCEFCGQEIEDRNSIIDTKNQNSLKKIQEYFQKPSHKLKFMAEAYQIQSSNINKYNQYLQYQIELADWSIDQLLTQAPSLQPYFRKQLGWPKYHPPVHQRKRLEHPRKKRMRQGHPWVTYPKTIQDQGNLYQKISKNHQEKQQIPWWQYFPQSQQANVSKMITKKRGNTQETITNPTKQQIRNRQILAKQSKIAKHLERNDEAYEEKNIKYKIADQNNSYQYNKSICPSRYSKQSYYREDTSNLKNYPKKQLHQQYRNKSPYQLNKYTNQNYNQPSEFRHQEYYIKNKPKSNFDGYEEDNYEERMSRKYSENDHGNIFGSIQPIKVNPYSAKINYNALHQKLEKMSQNLSGRRSKINQNQEEGNYQRKINNHVIYESQLYDQQRRY